MQKILILGASSAIARGIAKSFAQEGHQLYLAARDLDDLKRTSTDLKVRYGINCFYGNFEALDFSQHPFFIQEAIQTLDGLDGVVVAFGHLTNPQSSIEFAECQKIIDVNLTAAISVINLVTDYFLQQKQPGFVIGISSVAGDRGRAENYVYGAAKAGFTTYLQGLRQRLFSNKIRIITVKPGYVDTPMVYGRPDVMFAANPEKVGATIARSLKRSRNVFYVPWFWEILMGIVKIIPEFIYQRMKIKLNK